MNPWIIIAISALGMIVASLVLGAVRSTLKFIFRQRKSSKVKILKKESKQKSKELKKVK